MIYAFSGVSPLLLCRNSAFPLSIALLFTPHKAVLSKEIRITYKKRLGYSFIKIYKWKLLSFKVVFLIKVERTLRVEPHRIATILLLLTTRKGNHTWKYANSISTCQNVTKQGLIDMDQVLHVRDAGKKGKHFLEFGNSDVSTYSYDTIHVRDKSERLYSS